MPSDSYQRSIYRLHAGFSMKKCWLVLLKNISKCNKGDKTM
jgi:hypothetical protein